MNEECFDHVKVNKLIINLWQICSFIYYIRLIEHRALNYSKVYLKDTFGNSLKEFFSVLNARLERF